MTQIATPPSILQTQQTLTNQTRPQSGKPTVPFRLATALETMRSIVDNPVFGASYTPVVQTLNGVGYLCYIDFDVLCTTSGNAATVAFKSGMPWGAIQNIVLRASGPEIFNLDGYSAYLLMLYGGHGQKNAAASTDSVNVYNLVTGSGGTGGSFRFKTRLNLALNTRNLIALAGNQDRGSRYELRTDVAPSTAIYSTPPTVVPATIQISRYLGFATLPPPQSADLVQQETQPPYYGVIHQASVLTNDSKPTSATSINHTLKGQGGLDRLLILEFIDSTGVYSDALLPTTIDFKLGTQPIFSETSDARRNIMFHRYGVDAPAGILVYDFISDFGAYAGMESGYNWMQTRNIVDIQFVCNYPTFANTPGVLKVVTDYMVVPDGMPLIQFT